MNEAGFWSGRRVLITGHMGFKGAWLTAQLDRAGAYTIGFGRDARPDPLLYRRLRFRNHLSIDADVNETDHLRATLVEQDTEIVFHLAAQPFVRASYGSPLGTVRDNALGTASVLDAIRTAGGVRAAIIVTSDKVYDNREWVWPYRETDRLGGADPYSASKAAAEIITAAFRRSFFSGEGATQVATVRAGNVIGGGDWGADRLLPDAAIAFAKGSPLMIRNPRAVRPWQHVLDALAGYMLVARKMIVDGYVAHPEWNFGPDRESALTVQEVADLFCAAWGDGASWEALGDTRSDPHEAFLLGVDSSRAKSALDWRPQWDVKQSITRTARWYRAFYEGADAEMLVDDDLRAFSVKGTAPLGDSGIQD